MNSDEDEIGVADIALLLGDGHKGASAGSGPPSERFTSTYKTALEVVP